MNRRQLITILYLIAGLILALAAIYLQNPLLGPIGLLCLILGGLNSQARNEKGF